MFFISNTLLNLTVNNSIFTANLVKSQLIDATNLFYHLISNTQCLMNNQNIFEDYQYLGGCFRSANVNERLYYNVTISYCYSDFTTVGIKIIDSESIIFYQPKVKKMEKTKEYLNCRLISLVVILSIIL